MPDYAIEAEALTKKFGEFTAVGSLSLAVKSGSIYGFLGPNGSGKSTCIRMLCGLLPPTSGAAKVNDHDIVRDSEAVKQSIGYMNQAFSLYRDLTVDENLTFFGGAYGLRGDRLKQRKLEVMGMTGLEPYAGRFAGQLSGGWKQRLALAAALIHEPRLVFLDEPTSGIDPVARRALWDLLFDLAGAGKTLFVTTHYMDEAERCSEIGYIFQSRLLAQGTPQQLKDLPEVSPAGQRRLAVSTSRPSAALVVLKKNSTLSEVTLIEAEVHLQAPDLVTDADIVSQLKQAGISDGVVRETPASLEDVFVALTRRSQE